MQELATLNEMNNVSQLKLENLQEKYGDIEEENMKFRLELANLREQ